MLLLLKLSFGSSDTATTPDNSTTPWLAGLRLDQFPGPSFGEQVSQAAHSIGADILSPAAVSSRGTAADPTLPGFIPFTTRAMVEESHQLGMEVKPWTVGVFQVLTNPLLIAFYPRSIGSMSWSSYFSGGLTGLSLTVRGVVVIV